MMVIVVARVCSRWGRRGTGRRLRRGWLPILCSDGGWGGWSGRLSSDCERIGRGGERIKSPEVSSVPCREPSRAVGPYCVLVILQYFHDRARLVPLRWVTSSLVLDHDCVTTTEWGQALGVFVPSGTAGDLASGQRTFTEVQSRCPVLVRAVSGRESGEEVSGGPSKEALCRGHASVGAWSISVL